MWDERPQMDLAMSVIRKLLDIFDDMPCDKVDVIGEETYNEYLKLTEEI